MLDEELYCSEYLQAMMMSAQQAKRALRFSQNQGFLVYSRKIMPPSHATLMTATVQAAPGTNQEQLQVPRDHASTMQAILQEYKQVFEAPSSLPQKRDCDHRIDLVPDAVPVARPLYRMSEDELQEMRKVLTTMLDNGFIRPSNSDWAAPAMFVAKHTEPGQPRKLRMVIDYRALNKLTIKSKWPLPHIDMMLDLLHGAKYFTKIDMANAFYQLRMHEPDIPKTAFRTRYGLFEFLVMPMGLTNSQPAFRNWPTRCFLTCWTTLCVYTWMILSYFHAQQKNTRGMCALCYKGCWNTTFVVGWTSVLSSSQWSSFSVTWCLVKAFPCVLIRWMRS